MRCEGSAFDRLKIENDNIESALCRNGRIELPERSCRGVTGICEKLFAVFFTFCVQSFKSFFRHIDLSADDQLRKLFVENERN